MWLLNIYSQDIIYSNLKSIFLNDGAFWNIVQYLLIYFTLNRLKIAVNFHITIISVHGCSFSCS